MVLDASLLNTQHYKVWIKGKVEQFRERSGAPPTPWCSSYWKRNLRVTIGYSCQLFFFFFFFFFGDTRVLAINVEYDSMLKVQLYSYLTVRLLIIFTNPSARAGYDTRSIFQAEFNRFEFRVFLLLD